MVDFLQSSCTMFLGQPVLRRECITLICESVCIFLVYCLALKDETGSCKKTVKCSVGRDEELACKIVFFYAFMTEKLVVSDLYLRNTN